MGMINSISIRLSGLGGFAYTLLLPRFIIPQSLGVDESAPIFFCIKGEKI